jgi:metallo-beta-lactamase class B
MKLAALAASPLAAQTAEELFRRNIGSPEQFNKQFPPHKVIGNIYYVGSESLASFLFVTPQGNILLNSCFEATVPVIRSSVEKLGFKFTDIKILLGSHAHADHMEGDALVKELTGAQVMAMEQDVPALMKIQPRKQPHPLDRTLHDSDPVTLGGATLVAHLTAGHTRGCTTWTTQAQEGRKTYDVVIIGSVGVNPGYVLVNNKDVPDIAGEYQRSFKLLRSLPCDVPLGSHPSMYNLAEKYPKLGKGPNPFIDPEGYKHELDIQEHAFLEKLTEQKKAAGV